MTLEIKDIDHCKHESVSDPEAYETGKGFGYKLAHGRVKEASDQFDAFRQEAYKQAHGDSDAVNKTLEDFAQGMACTDPIDVVYLGDELTPDFGAEKLVNAAFDSFNKYKIKLEHNHGKQTAQSTSTDAAKKATSVVHSLLKRWSLDDDPIYKDDFIKDFNRRRLDDKFLSEFKAFDEDGQVSIKYVGDQG